MGARLAGMTTCARWPSTTRSCYRCSAWPDRPAKSPLQFACAAPAVLQQYAAASSAMPKERPKVNIGEVIRSYRGERGLSQGDIERRTGLLRCYLSRVENGHTVPSLETLAKIAEA